MNIRSTIYAYAWVSLVIALASPASWSAEGQRELERLPDFEVEVSCDEGTARIALLDLESGAQLDIGSISKRGARTEPTTRLLSAETRRWIASEILSLDGFGQGSEGAVERQWALGACTGRPDADTSGATGGCVDYLNTCTCYPDENGRGCGWFAWACTASGGNLGHNICTY